MLVHLIHPCAGAFPPFELLPDKIEDSIERCRSARGRVENENAVAFFAHSFLTLFTRNCDLRSISKAVFDLELFFQQLVETLDDVVNDRLGCVINSAQFSQLRIVSVQKCFIKVNDRITATIARAEIPKNLVDVRVTEHLYDVLDKSCEWFVVQFVAGDLFKEISQKRICAWNKLARILACESATRPSSTR